MRVFALALLGPAMILAAAEPSQSPWKIENNPVLTPGDSNTWDSQSITYPSVVRTRDKWMLIYQGTAIDESGPHTAFGCAQSEDGIVWKKIQNTPVFSPDTGIDQLTEAPNFTAWKGGFSLVYLVNPFLVRGHPGREYENSGREPRLAQSTDALHWRDLRVRHLPLGSNISADSAPCIYADKRVLYLWWIGAENDKLMLCHSVSRDGVEWSKPSAQPTSEIDSRPILDARVYPSGDFYLLTYVAETEEAKRTRSYFLVTKVSRDARTWTRKGPPEFALPQPCVPFMVFTPGGARLYYDEQERTSDGRISTRATLRSAFCPKANYENR